ncbi:hydrogenase expression/formation protein HypE [Thermosulfurimonas sp. F29]|uniref:hydrogenase expression/formation protein HypE n=1 Tax=Thermosulfurimonas sp. F29 TaxID=2867247 RepID=UPI001C83A363|nr:hydrogenase expression/formation protein HypE [Thermosulfurimonas sp. F29]MBX6423718.1 hydrogenase expression/formation protein HypE [Thermosulfurimonas sp. F29]
MATGREGIVLLDHGSGGRATHNLIREVFLSAFSGGKELLDAALLGEVAGPLAFTTDGFVVDPIFFPGGDIGSLAVHGTVNDLAMAGAEPLYLSCGFILEEGLPLEELRRVVTSMARAARDLGIPIVCGDTKVVPRGKGDRIYITTTGLGRIRLSPPPHPERIRPGDVVLVSGPVGEHGLAVLAAREGLPLTGLKSDSAPVWPLVKVLLEKLGAELHALRDPTRGGLATTLNELAEEAGACFLVEEAEIPLSPAVRGGSEILGLDPLYLACEGRFVAVVSERAAPQALEILKSFPEAREARIIGRVEERKGRPPVILRTRVGGERVLPVLTGEPLPRIC